MFIQSKILHKWYFLSVLYTKLFPIESISQSKIDLYVDTLAYQGGMGFLPCNHKYIVGYIFNIKVSKEKVH
jgi:hypothetical protein